MQVFLAGGTGVVGRRALPLLLAAGHEVTASVRSDASARLVALLGATPRHLDLFDPTAVEEAVAGHDAVINLATSIPPPLEAANPKAWGPNDRLRREGSRNLAAAAAASTAGAAVYVQESIAFARGEHGAEQVEEGGELGDAPIIASLHGAEAAVAGLAETATRGVVLRFGLFHAPESTHGRAFTAAARHGRLPLPGDPDGYLPIIHADDAAAAVVAALKAPAGTYEITVDECPTRRELAEAASSALAPLGIGPLRLPRGRIGERMRSSAPNLAWSQRVGNSRFRAVTAWRPAHRDARSVWAAVAGSLTDPSPVPSRWTRVALVLLALFGIPAGLWAGLAPTSFFADYPGFGLQWVSPDGPYNEHLLRDVGWSWVGLGAVTVAALAAAKRSWARLAGVAWLVFALPHFLYHVVHLDVYDTTADQVAVAVSTGALVIVAAVAAAAPRRRISG